MAQRTERTEPQESSALDVLKDKRRVFVLRYLEDFNAARAAREAGYAENSADREGYRLLRNAEVAAAIEEQLTARGITRDRVQVALAEIAFGADLADFEPWLRGEKTLKELEQGGVNTRLIESLAETPHGRRIQLCNRLAALKELGRVLGIVSEGRRVEGKVDADLRHLPDDELLRLAEAGGLDHDGPEAG